MERTKNALLFVIALCLVLIVLRLYSSGDFVKAAQAAPAQQGGISYLYGCVEGTYCNSDNWKPVRVNAGGALQIAK
jgi:hypothetical protein